MSDLNWCTYCDKAISVHSNSLYCSEECLRADALNHHPLLGYDYAELKGFPHSSTSPTLTALSSSSTVSLSPLLSPIPSSLKEPSTFQLNFDNHDTNNNSLYQHIYQQKQQQQNNRCIQKEPFMMNTNKNSLIYLQPWNG
ncbi:uncharacterized protein BX663DRAFT_491022 [Cokeromyces recurvatus]|uniref:uncharacterized protein n=1 Tax=Cokeromyces recurvatus TaxID=90255 RepID=UPI00221F35ED|nr:uncharacterized protein BX663DRAFT_491022 [Cokeromyces recurvatus]KAI7907469.1 hypothetical protein BX663DRAFT_491022 [Cokeromyces recurvatus]